MYPQSELLAKEYAGNTTGFNITKRGSNKNKRMSEKN